MFYHERWPLFYEDNHLLVLYKPAGVLMQRGRRNKASMVDLVGLWLKKRYDKPGNVFVGLVHRLDGPVAGVVVLARTSKAAARLCEQFRNGAVTKQYLAVVEGRPPMTAARLENAILRQGRLSRLAAPHTPGSQSAVLHYRVMDESPQTSLVQVTLESGRHHQIRVQMAGLGCAIVGDTTYGASQAMAHGRIALLAYRLAFNHPVGGERLEFETPMPQGWPWPSLNETHNQPLWTVEAFEQQGLSLPLPILGPNPI